MTGPLICRCFVTITSPSGEAILSCRTGVERILFENEVALVEPEVARRLSWAMVPRTEAPRTNINIITALTHKITVAFANLSSWAISKVYVFGPAPIPFYDPVTVQKPCADPRDRTRQP